MRKQKVIKNGRVLIDNRFLEGDLVIRGGKISGFHKGSYSTTEEDDVIDGSGYYVVPGFIDVHTHGGNGIDVNLASTDHILSLAEFFASRGVTSFLPTILTDTPAEISKIMMAIDEAKKKQVTGAEIMGVHLEGPFLSKAYKGAMPDELILEASIEQLDQWLNIGLNMIKTMTIAPENTVNMEAFIRYAVSKGVTVSLGHTGATYEQCMASIEAGASKATHMFNAMGALHQHRPTIIGAALESDIYVEAICDGFHLHEGIVRLLLKAKGLDKVIAVTDSVMAAGLPDGNYQLGVNQITVKDCDAKLAGTDIRAGSTLTMDKALRNIMAFTHRSLEECIQLMTINPAKMLGIDHCKGTIEEGKDADIVLLDERLEVQWTMVHGVDVYHID